MAMEREQEMERFEYGVAQRHAMGRKYNKHQPHPELRFRFGKEELVITDEGLLKALKTYRAMRHRLRQDLLQYIYDKGRVNVNEIIKYFRSNPFLRERYGEIEQSVVSQHLGILREAGIVKRYKESRFNYYEVNPDKLREIANYTQNILWGEEGLKDDVEVD